MVIIKFRHEQLIYSPIFILSLLVVIQMGFRLNKVLNLLLLQIVDNFFEYLPKAEDNKKEIITCRF